MYLTPELKSYYSADFEKVLSIKEKYQKVADAVRYKLLEINGNPSIQTLYHHTYTIEEDTFPAGGSSSLTICYTLEIEQKLFHYLESIKVEFRADDFSIACMEPKDNTDYDPNSHFDIGCYRNADYYRIKHLRIEVETSELKKHNQFFETLAKGLSLL